MVDKFLKNSTVFKYFDKNFKMLENNINQNNSKLEEKIEILIDENRNLFNKCIDLQNQIKVIVEENNSINNRMFSEIKNVNCKYRTFTLQYSY